MQKEWGISWDYIENHWTDEQFVEMQNRLAERLEANRKAQERAAKEAKQKRRRAI